MNRRIKPTNISVENEENMNEIPRSALSKLMGGLEKTPGPGRTLIQKSSRNGREKRTGVEERG